MTKNTNRNYIKCNENTRDCTLIKKQYLESNGVVTITEPYGVILISAVVSGGSHMKDVTCNISYIIDQKDSPLDCITIDTGLLNEYTNGDIDCGSQKMIQIDYIKCCDDHTHNHGDDHTHNRWIPIIPPPHHHCPPCEPTIPYRRWNPICPPPTPCPPPAPHHCPPPTPCPPPAPHHCPPPAPHHCPPPAPHHCPPPAPHHCPPRPPHCHPIPPPCPPPHCEPPNPHAKCERKKRRQLRKQNRCNVKPICPNLPPNVTYNKQLLFPLYPIHCPVKYCGKQYSQQYPIRGPFKYSISPDLQCDKHCKCKKCCNHH